MAVLSWSWSELISGSSIRLGAGTAVLAAPQNGLHLTAVGRGGPWWAAVPVVLQNGLHPTAVGRTPFFRGGVVDTAVLATSQTRLHPAGGVGGVVVVWSLDVI